MFVYQRVHIESLKTPNSWQFPMGKCRGFQTMGCGTAGNLLFRTFDIRLNIAIFTKAYFWLGSWILLHYFRAVDSQLPIDLHHFSSVTPTCTQIYILTYSKTNWKLKTYSNTVNWVINQERQKLDAFQHHSFFDAASYHTQMAIPWSSRSEGPLRLVNRKGGVAQGKHPSSQNETKAYDIFLRQIWIKFMWFMYGSKHDKQQITHVFLSHWWFYFYRTSFLTDHSFNICSLSLSINSYVSISTAVMAIGYNWLFQWDYTWTIFMRFCWYFIIGILGHKCS